MHPKAATPLLVTALACLGFISIGLPDGLLGVAWPSIRGDFAIGLHALGPLLILFAAGYLLASFGSGALMARMNVGTLLALSCMLTSLALSGYVVAPYWPVMVGFALLAGLGAGAIDAGLNTFAAVHFSSRGVNWLHACYGVGAATGPLLITAVLMAGQSWKWGYGLVAFGQFALGVAFLASRRQWDGASAHSSSLRGGPSLRATLALPTTWLGVAVFFMYTGIEAAAGIWIYSLLTEQRSVPAAQAASWVSLYWACLTAGRIGLGAIANLLASHTLIRLCMTGLALGAALLWLDPAVIPRYVGPALMGLSAAAIFPTLIAASPMRLGHAHAANGIGFQVAGASVGQSFLPAAIGWLAASQGLEIIGPSLLVASLLLILLFEGLNRHTTSQ